MLVGTAAAEPRGGDSAEDEESQVPPELLRLTNLLTADGGLQTPGLFLSSAESAIAAAQTIPVVCRMAQQQQKQQQQQQQQLPQPGSMLAGKQNDDVVGVVLNVAEMAYVSSSSEVGSGEQRKYDDVVSAVHMLRECLDSGAPFPPGTGPPQAAATLLSWLAALPQPLLPLATAHTCDVCKPAVRCLWTRLQ